MYPEQPPQQMYHPPPPPHQQHHQSSMGMPPPSSSQYHHHQPQAPYEQDPSWRNSGACPGGNHVAEPTSHSHPIKSEGDGYSHSQYPSSMQMQGYPHLQGQQQQQHQHHQQHMHYQPAPPHYYQPPSVYGNHRPTAGSYPESSWIVAHPPPPYMNMPHYDDKNLPYYPPQPPPPPPHYPYGMSSGPYYHHSSSAPMLEPSPVGSGGETFHHTMDTTKRQCSPPAAFNEQSQQQKASHSQPHPSSPTSPRTAATSTTTSSTSLSLITKSARRKKKMYSDFVGVTYNKTHAKYQACITHYRKQHYLGRYKLAVDAALAYDESARLLKGTSWKVNFQTMQDYEKAKAKELEGVRRQNGSKVVDVAGSLAAVAMKVEEIASTVAMSSSSSAGAMIRSSNFLQHQHNNDSFHSLYEQRQLGPVDESTSGEGANAIEKVGSTTSMVVTQLSLPNDQSTLLNNTKVTPSPTLPISTPIVSSEQQQQQQQGESLSLSPQFSLAETPLPISPNPTRHALGNEKSTPDSVIRPKVLTYRPGGKECGSLPPLSEDGSETTPSISNSPSKIKGKEASASVKVESASDTKGATTTTGQYSPQKSNAIGTSITTTTTAFANSPAKNASVSPHKRAAPPPPVIQNGTLAAASALMTLFGNERSPTQENN